jgi:RNA polymerase sigma-70 factor (ECF subfamily)
VSLGEVERRALNAAMDRYAEGDDAAFAQVYDLIVPCLMAYCRRRLRNEARAEDAVQQTLMNIVRARSVYVSGSNLIPWAFAIARGVLIDMGRRERNDVLHKPMECDEANLARLLQDVVAPEDLASTRQLAQHVNELLASLPDGQQQAFELMRLDGLSSDVTAEILGTTSNAVRLRVQRVSDALREAVQRFRDGRSFKTSGVRSTQAAREGRRDDPEAGHG